METAPPISRAILEFPGCALPLPDEQREAEVRLEADRRRSFVRLCVREADTAHHGRDFASAREHLRAVQREDPTVSSVVRLIEIAVEAQEEVGPPGSLARCRDLGWDERIDGLGRDGCASADERR